VGLVHEFLMAELLAPRSAERFEQASFGLVLLMNISRVACLHSWAPALAMFEDLLGRGRHHTPLAPAATSPFNSMTWCNQNSSECRCGQLAAVAPICYFLSAALALLPAENLVAVLPLLETLAEYTWSGQGPSGSCDWPCLLLAAQCVRLAPPGILESVLASPLLARARAFLPIASSPRAKTAAYMLFLSCLERSAGQAFEWGSGGSCRSLYATLSEHDGDSVVLVPAFRCLNLLLCNVESQNHALVSREALGWHIRPFEACLMSGPRVATIGLAALVKTCARSPDMQTALVHAGLAGLVGRLLLRFLSSAETVREHRLEPEIARSLANLGGVCIRHDSVHGDLFAAESSLFPVLMDALSWTIPMGNHPAATLVPSLLKMALLAAGGSCQLASDLLASENAGELVKTLASRHYVLRTEVSGLLAFAMQRVPVMPPCAAQWVAPVLRCLQAELSAVTKTSLHCGSILTRMIKHGLGRELLGADESARLLLKSLLTPRGSATRSADSSGHKNAFSLV